MCRQPIVWIVLGMLAGSCAATNAPMQLGNLDKERARIEYVGREYVLGASLYLADFFGEPDRWFADPRPFEIISLSRADGQPVSLTTAPTAEIVPAGTPVRVTAVIFPRERGEAGSAPTGHTWLVLERSAPDANKTPLVLVLPREIPDVPTLTRLVADRLRPQRWVTSFLSKVEPLTLGHIFAKEAVVGMSIEEVWAAIGEPRNAAARAMSPQSFVADYGDLQLTFAGDKVSEVKRLSAERLAAAKSAEAAAAAARQAAAERAARKEARRAEQDAAAARRDAESRAAAARLEAERVAHDTEVARARQEIEKLSAAEQTRKREAELQARLEAAKLAKLEAEQERLRRIEQAKLDKRIAELEEQKDRARRQYEEQLMRANAAEKAARGAQAATAPEPASPRSTSVGRPVVALSSTEPATAEPGIEIVADLGVESPAATEVAAETVEETPTAAQAWWRGQMHFGVQLHYSLAQVTMGGANRLTAKAYGPFANGADTELFGAAHGIELSAVFVSPWHVRAQVGVGGLYDSGSVDISVPILDAVTLAQIGVQPTTITGRAWGVVVPVLVGYRLPLLQERLAVTADVGIEILAAAGLQYTSSAQAGDSPGMVAPESKVGWALRGGAAWHVLPRLAITVEVTGRGLRTDDLVFVKPKDQPVTAPDGSPVRLNFSGAGARVGVTGFFL